MTGAQAAGRRPRVVVVGAGIAGLAAAWQLVTSHRDGALDVVVLEASPRVGGKLAVGDLGGVQVDLGAESMLARRPEAVELAQQVGLGADLVAPAPVGAEIWSRGRRHPLPRGTLMGVPSGPQGLLGLLTAEEIDVVEAEPRRSWPPAGADFDPDVASFLASRVGQGVVDRLVEPLLGGVYAGSAGALSLRATIPALWDAAVGGGSLVGAAAAAVRRGQGTHAPVFNGIRGGLGRLPLAVAAALEARGASVQTGATVRGLARAADGWRVLTGPTTDEIVTSADAVVLATAAAPTARLLGEVAPDAARLLAGIEYASVAIVSLLLERAEVAGLAASGFLVPPVEGRYVKAATFSSSKWRWLAEADAEHVVVRASVGRHGAAQDLQLEDDEIVRRALTDLRSVPDVRLPEPRASRVTRWGGGLPQYAVGHTARVDAVMAGLTGLPGLALAGAAFDGVGIPACIASGRRAARRAATHLESVAGGGGQWRV